MKGPLFSKLKWVIGGLLLIAYAQNCTKADFSEAPAADTAGRLGGPGDTTKNPDTEIPTQPTPTPGPQPPGAGFPKLSFDYEFCPHNSDCPKKMLLSEPDARTILLKWKTNEARAAANPDTLCQPTTGYVPTSGQVSYSPGQTEKTVIVRQLACDVNHTIPITITACYANGTQFDCSLLQ